MDDGGPTAGNIVLIVVIVLLAELCLYIIARMLKQYMAKNKDGSAAEEEIISMINEGHEQGLIQASEARMITNIFEFDDKQARDIMTHRSNIVANSIKSLKVVHVKKKSLKMGKKWSVLMSSSNKDIEGEGRVIF